MVEALVLSLTLAGICLAAAAIFPLRGMTLLVASPQLKRTWNLLAIVICACVALQILSLWLKAWDRLGPSDVAAAGIHLLGPAFVLATAWLARASARELTRLADYERAALTDALTGLPNRRHFDIRLAAEIEAARSLDREVTLVLMDIDYFKRVNDAFGHGAGDRVLKRVADLMREALGAKATAARIGGEEFGLLFVGFNAARASQTIERLRLAVESTRFALAHGQTTQITASLGLAALVPDDTLDSLVERADAALYAAKHAGRNRVNLAA